MKRIGGAIARQSTLLPLVLAVALVVAGCGNGGDTASGTGERELDRCSLISAAEAEQWLGSPVSAAPAEGFDGKPDLVTCDYQVEDQFIEVFVQVYDGEVYYAEEGSPARTGEAIDGLGEDAWTAPGDVNFLQNDWTVSVTRIVGQIPDEALMEMAQLISSRLP